MVKDVNKTIDFYTSVLGFKRIMTVPEEGKFVWAMVGHGSVMLMFQAKESLLEEYSCLKNQSFGGGLTFFIRVSDVEDLYEKIKDKVEIVKKMGITPYGMKEFAIQDMNGFVLTFAEEKS